MARIDRAITVFGAPIHAAFAAEESHTRAAVYAASNSALVSPYSPHMQFLANLAAVLVRPRRTMRRILDSPRRRMVLPMVLLVVISGIFGDFDAPTAQKYLQQSGGWQVWLMVTGVVVCVIAAMVGLFYLYAWVPYFVGRFLGGTGDVRGVRAALAWGLAPAVWALLYRVPGAIWFASSSPTAVRLRNGKVGFDPGMMANGCGVALVFMFLELIVIVWCAVAMSNTVAEAHDYSALHGLGTLVISAMAPVVVMIAAVLAIN